MTTIKIGETLKTLRIQKGLNQEQLGDALHMSRSSYANYENGTRLPSLDIACKMAEYFQIPLHRLIFGLDDFDELIENFPSEHHEFLKAYIELPSNAQKELMEHLKIMKKYRKL